MPTSKNSPTAAETSVTDVSSDQPVTSDGDTSEARVEELHDSMAGKGVTVTDDMSVTDSVHAGPKPASDQDVSGDFEKQYPGPVDEDDEDDEDPLSPQEKLEQEDAEEAETGSTWARYMASGNHMRGITVEDQRSIGVPEDALVDNSEDARPRTLEGKLAKGLWFTMQNRFRTDVSEVHPILREYLEEDQDFTVKTY